MPKVKKSLFKMKFQRKTSFDVGRLVPIFSEEVVPGDIIRLASKFFFRFSPLLAPVLHDFTAYFHLFFCPNRIIWQNWQRFITGGPNNDTDTSDPAPVAPFLVFNSAAPQTINGTRASFPGSLYDHLKYPCRLVKDGSTGSTGLATFLTLRLNALPYRAYFQIFNDWYLDTDLISPYAVSLADGVDWATGKKNSDSFYDDPLDRLWIRDYFTSIRPAPQRGTPASVPVNGTSQAQSASINASGTTQSGPYTPSGYVNSTFNGHSSKLPDPTIDMTPVQYTTSSYFDYVEGSFTGQIPSQSFAASLPVYFTANSDSSFPENYLYFVDRGVSNDGVSRSLGLYGSSTVDISNLPHISPGQITSKMSLLRTDDPKPAGYSYGIDADWMYDDVNKNSALIVDPYAKSPSTLLNDINSYNYVSFPPPSSKNSGMYQINSQAIGTGFTQSSTIQGKIDKIEGDIESYTTSTGNPTAKGGDFTPIGSVSSDFLGIEQHNIPGQTEVSGQVNLPPSAVVGSVLVSDIRLATQLQIWAERAMRYGYRYVDTLFSHFNVIPQDSRLQRSEYIGGKKFPISISEVVQTSQTTADSPLGQFAGHAIGVDSSDRPLKYKIQEHGWLIGLISILPVSQYQDAAPLWSTRRSTKFDYLWPEFSGLGDQSVPNSAVCAISDQDIAFADFPYRNDYIFGYQPRYEEYRRVYSTAHGVFRTILSYWHAGRIFNYVLDKPDLYPQLGKTFLTSVFDTTSRIFAIDPHTNDSVFCVAEYRYNVLRSLSKRGIPHGLDHTFGVR